MIVIPDVVDAATAATLRARCAFTRFTGIDRGSYDYAALDDAPLFARLAALASGDRRVTEARVLRLVAGDYLLAHADRIFEDAPLEAVVDLSPAVVPEASVDYRRRGQVVFRFASQPGAVCLVERGPTITSNHTYISKRYATAEVVRLVALLK